MSIAVESLLGPVRPSDEDVRLARRSAPMLQRFLRRKGAVTLTVEQDEHASDLELPPVVLRMVGMILNELAEGRGVALAAIDREVSTGRAAEILNVSRPHLVKILESGKIPFRKVGSHRRLRLADVMEYRARQDAETDRAFGDLVAQAQELGLGYD
jgi:excisionase family DNA binding protein